MMSAGDKRRMEQETLKIIPVVLRVFFFALPICGPLFIFNNRL